MEYKVDLDSAVRNYITWNKKSNELERDNSLKQVHIDNLKLNINEGKNREFELSNELQKLNDIIFKLQDTLKNRVNYEEKNALLNTYITHLKKESAKYKKDLNAEQFSFQKKLDKQSDCNAMQLVLMEDIFSNKEKDLVFNQNKEVSILEDETANLKINIKNMKEKHDAYLIKLRIENDEKLSILKRENQVNNLKKSNTIISTKQDLFRKKFQNLQMSSQKEISELKNEISNLENKIALKDKLLNQNPISLSSMSSLRRY